MTASAGVSRL